MKIHKLLFILLGFLLVESVVAIDDKGVRYFREGDFDKALEYYESILRKQNHNNYEFKRINNNLDFDENSSTPERLAIWSPTQTNI